jgi:hypothetical protein
VAPPTLARRFPSLPPILHRVGQHPMPGYSKGSRGLSVFPRVLGIFTETTISPSLWSRQRSDRYAFRAGRNLPDKEFRYLRTVIVTAAIDQRFSRQLHPKGLTSFLNVLALGRRQPLYIVFST